MFEGWGQVTFTYGAWGIVTQISQLSSSGLTRSYQAYNYPDASTALAAPPTYTQQTVFDGSASSTRVWNYASLMSNNMVSQTTITDPGGTATVATMFTASGDWKDGLVSIVQSRDGSGNVLRQITNNWTSDATTNANPRLSSVLTTLSDTGQQSRVDFVTYDVHGCITDQKEYDFGLVLKRETLTTYLTADESAHIWDRPTQIIVKDANGTNISRVDLQYSDAVNSPAITGAAGHNDSYAAPRANLTSITRYADPVNAAGAITRNFSYDSLGNLTKADLDCCNQKQWNFSSATQYAYPDSVVRGPVGTQLTTSATYYPDTGLLKTFTDENLQVTQYAYDSMNRIETVTQPDSVVITYTPDDSGVSAAVSVSSSANSAVRKTILDGLGRTLKNQLLNASTLVSTTETQYDDINRQVKTSNPYAPGETTLWTVNQFDALGRISQTTPPSGGSYAYQYSGNTTLVTDPAGKQRRTFTDTFGRLTQVDEPTPGLNTTGTPGSAVITISGAEAISNPGTKATGWFQVSGSDEFVLSCGPSGLCNPRFEAKIWDSGSVEVTVNGAVASGNYGQSSTAAGIASGLAAQLNPHPITYSDNGAGTISLTADTPGPNYALSASTSSNDPDDFSAQGSFSVTLSGPSLTGGVYPTYDSGTLSITVNGIQASASYNQSANTTAAAISSSLAAAVNGNTSMPVTASANGGSITLTAKFYGASTNYTVSLSPNTVSYSMAVTTSGGAPTTTLAGGTDPLSTTYTYNAAGDLTTVTQGAQTRNYNYDGLGRLTSTVLPENGTTRFTYTDFGAVLTRTDARGVVTTYGYDGLNRLSSTSYNVGTTGVPATPSVGFQYGTDPAQNNNGRLTKMTDGLGSESYTYDLMGRINLVSKAVGSAIYNTQYGYNNASQLTTLTYPSGRIVHPGYDVLGRLTQVTDNTNNYLTNMGYNSAQQPTGFNYGNGVVASFGYNDHLQLSTLKYSLNASDLLNLTYSYQDAQGQNNGQIQGITDTRGAAFSTTYAYDGLGRLQQAQTNDLTAAGTWRLAWTYDRYGNRLTQTLTGGTISVGQPQLTVDPATNHISGFGYDANGNLIHDGPSNSNTYTFDAENRMVKSVVGTTTTNYSYDGSNLRVVKDSTAYIYSGAKVIAEYASGAAPTSPSKEYIYSGSRLVTSVASGILTYHHGDHLSNRLETDANGNVVRTFCNLPFGDIWYENTGTDKWKFTTFERDSETSFDYAVSRFYASGYGRFLTPDLLGGTSRNPQSLNRYAYVQNDPTDSIDPLGLSRCNFNIGIDNSAGLNPGQIGEIENRINQIFSATNDPNGNTVGAVFNFSGKADYTLHLDAGSPNYDGLYFFAVVPPTVYTGSVMRDYGAGNFGIAAGTVGAHELYHNIHRRWDEPYNGEPNLMNSDGATDLKIDTRPDETSPIPQGFSKLTAQQAANLFKKCAKKHGKNGGGGGSGGPKLNVPADPGSGGGGGGADAPPIEGGDPCPNGDCADPNRVGENPPTLHTRGGGGM